MEKLRTKLTWSKVKNKMNMIDCVQYYFPKVTKEEADYLIWEDTCFPFSTDKALDQLWEMYNKYSQGILKAKLKKILTSS